MLNRHTIKPGTAEHGTTVHRRPEDWRNTGTLAEQRNTGKTIGIARNSGTYQEQRSNLITKELTP